MMTAVRGPHSYYIPGQPRMVRLDWVVEQVDFDEPTLKCAATLTFDTDGQVDLDTRRLEIESVLDTVNGRSIDFTHHPSEMVVQSTLVPEDSKQKVSELDRVVLGRRLSLSVPTDRKITIKYRTLKDSPALQWLKREQTVGKKDPLLFTLGVFLYARLHPVPGRSFRAL